MRRAASLFLACVGSTVVTILAACSGSGGIAGGYGPSVGDAGGGPGSPGDGSVSHQGGNGDGSAPPPKYDAGPCPNCKIAFVTSGMSDGALGGLTGGDATCQKAAQAAQLPGTYKAWLSDGTTAGSPPARFTTSDTGYMRTDSVRIIGSFSELVYGADLLVPLDRDEHGAQVVGVDGGDAGASVPVWTGVNDNANFVTTGQDLICESWTTNQSFDEGVIGYADAPAGLPDYEPFQWTVSNPPGINCNSLAHLYCFQQ
jgi:hypothetical protein